MNIEVKKTPAGPQLVINGIVTRTWLGCVHDDEAEKLARELRFAVGGYGVEPTEEDDEQAVSPIVTITADQILVQGHLPHGPGAAVIDWSCRLAALETCAWAIRRISQEMQKSIGFYYTGEPVDQIGVE